MFGFNLNKFVDKIQQQVPVAKMAVNTLVGGEEGAPGSPSSQPGAGPRPGMPRPQSPGMGPLAPQGPRPGMGPGPRPGMGPLNPQPPRPGMGVPGQQPPRPAMGVPGQQPPRPGMGVPGQQPPRPAMGVPGQQPPRPAMGVPDQQSPLLGFGPPGQQQAPRPGTVRPTGPGPGGFPPGQPSQPRPIQPGGPMGPGPSPGSSPSPRPMSMSPPQQPPPPPDDMMGDLAGLSEEERQHIAAVLQRAQAEMEASPSPTPPPPAAKQPAPTTAQPSKPAAAASSSPPPPPLEVTQRPMIPTVTIQPTSPTESHKKLVESPVKEIQQLTSEEEPDFQQPQQQEAEEEEEIQMEQIEFQEPNQEQRRLLFGSSAEASPITGSIEESGLPQQHQQRFNRIEAATEEVGIGLPQHDVDVHFVPEEVVGYGYGEGDLEQDQEVPMGDDLGEEERLMEEEEEQITSPAYVMEEEVEETPEPQYDYEEQERTSYSMSDPRHSGSSLQHERFQDEVMDFTVAQQQIVIPRNDDYYYQTYSQQRQSFEGSQPEQVLQPQRFEDEIVAAEVQQDEEQEEEEFEFATRLPSQKNSRDNQSIEVEEEPELELCPICHDAALDMDLDSSKVCADCERYICQNCGNFEQEQHEQAGGAADLSSGSRLRQWLCVECESHRQMQLRRTLTEKWAVTSSKTDRRLTKAATVSAELVHDMPQPHPVNEASESATTSERRQSLPDTLDAGESDVGRSMVPTVKEMLADDARTQHHRQYSKPPPQDDDESSRYGVNLSLSIGPSASEVVGGSGEEPKRSGAESEVTLTHSEEPGAIDFSQARADYQPEMVFQREKGEEQEELVAPENLAVEQPTDFSMHVDDEEFIESPPVGYQQEYDEFVPTEQDFDYYPPTTTHVQQQIVEDEPEFIEEEEEDQQQPFEDRVPPDQQPPVAEELPASGEQLVPETEFEYQEVRWYSKYSDENLQELAEGGQRLSDSSQPSTVIHPLADKDEDEDARYQPGTYSSGRQYIEDQHLPEFTLSSEAMKSIQEMTSQLSEELADELPREFGVVIRATPPSSSHLLSDAGTDHPPSASTATSATTAPSPATTTTTRASSNVITTAPQTTEQTSTSTIGFQYQQAEADETEPELAEASDYLPPVSESTAVPDDLQQQWLQQFQGSTDFSYYSTPPSQPPPPPPVPPRQTTSGSQQAPSSSAGPNQTWPPASSTPGLPSDLSPILDVSPSIEEFEEELMIEQQKQFRGEEEEEEEMMEGQSQDIDVTDQLDAEELPPRLSEEELSSIYKCDDLSSSFSRLKKSPKFECGLSDLVQAAASASGAEVEPGLGEIEFLVPESSEQPDATALPHSESGDHIQMESLGSFNIMVKPPSKESPTKPKQPVGVPKHDFSAVQPKDIDYMVEDIDQKQIGATEEPTYESVHSISEDIVKSFSLDATSIALKDDSITKKPSQKQVVAPTTRNPTSLQAKPAEKAALPTAVPAKKPAIPPKPTVPPPKPVHQAAQAAKPKPPPSPSSSESSVSSAKPVPPKKPAKKQVAEPPKATPPQTAPKPKDQPPAILPSQAERRDNFLRASGPEQQGQKQQKKTAEKAKPTKPVPSQQQVSLASAAAQQRVKFQVSPQSSTSSTSAQHQKQQQAPEVVPKPTKKTVRESSGDVVSPPTSRGRTRRKLPEVPQNAEPFNGVPNASMNAPISSLLQLAAFQRSTSPQGSTQQQFLASTSRTLPRSSRFALAESSRQLSPSGIKRSSSAGRGALSGGGEQSPESLLVEATLMAAENRRVGFNLPGQHPLFINTSSNQFRSRSLPQSPGSHVSPRFGNSPIRVASPGAAANVLGGDVSSSKIGSPRLSASSLAPSGVNRFVHVHGVTVPAELKEIKDQLNVEIRLATANRRRLLDELEIRRLERQLEEIRELERQQKASMQKRLHTAPPPSEPPRSKMPTSPTLRSALLNKQQGQTGQQQQQQQMSVSFMQTPTVRIQQHSPSPQPTGSGGPRLLEPSRWPAQQFPLQKQYSDPALFSPLHDSYYSDQAGMSMGGDGRPSGVRWPLSQDDSMPTNRYTNYGTLPRGGIISPNTGRIIPLSKYQQKGERGYSTPPFPQSQSATSAVSQQCGGLGDEIDAHVALLKDEIYKRKEQIENTQYLEGELHKLTEEAKKRCDTLQTRIISSDQQFSAAQAASSAIPSNIVGPLTSGSPVSTSMSKPGIIRPLNPESPLMFANQPPARVMSPPAYGEVDPYASTMPQPVRMAPEFAAAQLNQQHQQQPASYHHQPPAMRQPASPPPPHMMGPQFPPAPPPPAPMRQPMGPPPPPQPPYQQHPPCTHCHNVFHQSHGQVMPPPPTMAAQQSPFGPPGFPPGHYEDFTSRSVPGLSLQPSPGQQGLPQQGPSQRLTGSHAEMGGFQDFSATSRHVMCPHCSVRAGSTNHLLHHHPAGDFNHHSAPQQPQPQPQQQQQRNVMSGLNQPLGQLIGRTTADGGRGDPSQLNAKRRVYPYPVKRILLTRDPRDKSVRSNGLGMRIVGGKQVPGGPEGELGAFVVQLFQGGVADQLHGEVKEGDQVLEWNGISLCGRTFEDVLQIINQPCEEIELVLKAGDHFHHASTPHIPRPGSHGSFYDNMDPSGDYDVPPNVMTTSSTGAEMFEAQSMSMRSAVARRGGPPYADERHGCAMGTRGRISSTGSANRRRAESSSSAEVVGGIGGGDISSSSMPHSADQHGGSSGEVQLAITYDEYERVLTIELLRGRNLAPSEDKLPSPYVRLRLNPVKGQTCIQTSSQLYSTANPEYHQAFGFPLSSSASLSRRTLDVCVWDLVDADRKREKLIGETVISMANSALIDGRPHWYRLRPPSPEPGLAPTDASMASAQPVMGSLAHQHPPMGAASQHQHQPAYAHAHNEPTGPTNLSSSNPYVNLNGCTSLGQFKSQQGGAGEPTYSRQRHLTGGNATTTSQQPITCQTTTTVHNRSVYFDDQIRCVDDYPEDRGAMGGGGSMAQYR